MKPLTDCTKWKEWRMRAEELGMRQWEVMGSHCSKSWVSESRVMLACSMPSEKDFDLKGQNLNKIIISQLGLESDSNGQHTRLKWENGLIQMGKPSDSIGMLPRATWSRASGHIIVCPRPHCRVPRGTAKGKVKRLSWAIQTFELMDSYGWIGQVMRVPEICYAFACRMYDSDSRHFPVT